MLLVGNGRLVTRGSKHRLIENGCVAVDGRLIKEVGDTAALRAKYPDAEFLDARGGVIMPGMINAHNHIYSAFSRGLSIDGYNPRNFLEILDGMWWTIDRNLLLRDTYYSAMANYIDCIKNGVTTMIDHHASYGEIRGSLFAIADAAREAGVRSNLCYEVSDRDGEEKMREAVAENAEWIRYAQADDSGMLAGMMGMHASFTLSDATMALCRENTPAGVGFHIHVAEGMDDVYDSLAKYGKRVVNRLFDQDILGEHTLLGHCIHINGLEMDIVRQTGCSIVHNPESNMGNAVGVPPIIEFFKRGLPVGLGTDGFISDMITVGKFVIAVHRHTLCNPTVGFGEAAQALFENNAAIAGRGFGVILGALEPGAAADIVVNDYIPPTPLTADNVNGHILYGMSSRGTTATIIDGKVRMKDRRLVDIDEEAVLAGAREHAAAMARRINSK